MPQVGFPYSDPGSLQGGVREHRAILNSLQADAFRSASQAQNTGQAARAFSGATVTNSQAQTANLSQTVTANNTKLVTIATTQSVNAHADNFNYNYLQSYIAGADAADYLARGAANVAQDQGVDQSAFAKLNDFEGDDSVAQNTLTQTAQVEQTFDVDLTATVSNTTMASDVGHAYNQARFREVGVDLKDQSAQAIFTSGQRQGTADAALSQVAVSDGAGDTNGYGVDNNLTQTGTVTQTGNSVVLEGQFDLSVDESNTLSPRTTDLYVHINSLGGTNSSINSSASSQEQAMVQSAAGGVDEDGNVTENGGLAHNTGASDLWNQEDTTVQNSITITI